MKKYLIYVLKCPKSQEIRYVGVTCSDIKQRYAQHIWTGKKQKGTYCAKWISSLLNQGFKPIIEIIDKCNEDNWQDKEIFYIKLYKEKGCKLVNLQKGGSGINNNRHKSAIQRSAESKYIPVYQCDNNYSIIKLWESSKVASIALGISVKSIYKCLEQRLNSNPTAGGFKWVHKDMFDNNSFLRKNKKSKIESILCKSVIKKDINNNIIEIYETITIAAKMSGMSDNMFRRRLKKGIVSIGNFTYELKDK